MHRQQCDHRRGLVITLALTAVVTNLLYAFFMAGCSTGASLSPVAAAPASRPPDVEMDRLKWRYIEETITAQRARQEMAARIDGYFANRGSPMVGLGDYIVKSCERFNVNPFLVVGIAEAESSSGLACFAPHAYWGGLAYPSGFDSWEESVDTLVEWLHRYYGSPQRMTDCPGYCEGNGTMTTVDGVIDSI